MLIVQILTLISLLKVLFLLRSFLLCVKERKLQVFLQKDVTGHEDK